MVCRAFWAIIHGIHGVTVQVPFYYFDSSHLWHCVQVSKCQSLVIWLLSLTRRTQVGYGFKTFFQYRRNLKVLKIAKAGYDKQITGLWSEPIVPYFRPADLLHWMLSTNKHKQLTGKPPRIRSLVLLKTLLLKQWQVFKWWRRDTVGTSNIIHQRQFVSVLWPPRYWLGGKLSLLICDACRTTIINIPPQILWLRSRPRT